MPDHLGDATCLIFVPGDRPERFHRAQRSGAHGIVLDLEAAVIPGRKELARDAVVAWLHAAPRSAAGLRMVRVNPVASAWFGADATALHGVGRDACSAAMLAMTTSVDDLARARALLPTGLPIVALIETAAGVLAAEAIARSGVTARIAFGNMDYHTDTNTAGQASTLFPSSLLVAASRAAGLPAPLAGVTAAFRDAKALEANIAFERGLGFGGKLCIHPDQVQPILAGFRPDPAQIAWARRVVAASAHSHAVELDGELVDRPVIDRARRILARAGEAAGNVAPP